MSPESKFKPIIEKESAPKETEQSADASPTSRALEILKSFPKDFFGNIHADEKSDIATKADPSKPSIEPKSFREAFLKILSDSGEATHKEAGEGGQGTTPLPPVLKQPQDAEGFSKPFYGIDKDCSQKPAEPNLWTPLLDRNKSQQSQIVTGSSHVSNWEVDTPYVSR